MPEEDVVWPLRVFAIASPMKWSIKVQIHGVHTVNMWLLTLSFRTLPLHARWQFCFIQKCQLDRLPDKPLQVHSSPYKRNSFIYLSLKRF